MTLKKNGKKVPVENVIPYTIRRDDIEVIEDHMTKQVKEDKRFQGKYSNVEKVTELGPQGSQLFAMPIGKLISGSIPHGSWPAGGEVNLDYKNTLEYKNAGDKRF